MSAITDAIRNGKRSNVSKLAPNPTLKPQTNKPNSTENHSSEPKATENNSTDLDRTVHLIFQDLDDTEDYIRDARDFLTRENLADYESLIEARTAISWSILALQGACATIEERLLKREIGYPSTPAPTPVPDSTLAKAHPINDVQSVKAQDDLSLSDKEIVAKYQYLYGPSDTNRFTLTRKQYQDLGSPHGWVKKLTNRQDPETPVTVAEENAYRTACQRLGIDF